MSAKKIFSSMEFLKTEVVDLNSKEEGFYIGGMKSLTGNLQEYCQYMDYLKSLKGLNGNPENSLLSHERPNHYNDNFYANGFPGGPLYHYKKIKRYNILTNSTEAIYKRINTKHEMRKINVTLNTTFIGDKGSPVKNVGSILSALEEEEKSEQNNALTENVGPMLKPIKEVESESDDEDLMSLLKCFQKGKGGAKP